MTAILTNQEERILLAIFHLGDGAYLVNIRSKLKELTGKTYDVGTIYVPLKRLHTKGYLDIVLGKPTAVRGGKAIRYYRLTKQGSDALAELKCARDRLWDGVVLPVGSV